MSGGRSPKRKGTRVERELVNELVALGVACHRVPLSGAAGGEWSHDIRLPLLGRVLNVEVKCRSKLQFYSWLGSADLLLVKADRCPPLAVLPLALLVELMLAAERGAKV
jgi:Holliday junction resolvase